jgi:hypothetical protein
MTRLFALLALVLVSACGGSPFELELSIHLGSDVDADTESKISAFEIAATGGETFSETLSLGRAPNETERIVYRPQPTTRNLELTIGGLDTGKDLLVSGSVAVTLNASGATKADVTLDRVAAMPDLAVDVDMALPDALERSDLYTPPPDMTLVCGLGSTCYDFESGSGLPTQKGSNNCVVSSDRAFHGTKSLHCTGTAADAFLPPETIVGGGPVGIRAHVYSTPPSGSGEGVGYVGLVHAEDTAQEYAGDFGGDLFGFQYSETSNTQGKVPSAITDAPGAWHCMEILFTPPTSLGFYLDGTQVGATITNLYTDSDPSPTLAFGLAYVSTTTEFYDVYLDDISFGPGRQGCN